MTFAEFQEAHHGPGGTDIVATPLSRAALQLVLTQRLDAAELRRERMLCGNLDDGFRLIFLLLAARLRRGHPRASWEDLLQDLESALRQGPGSDSDPAFAAHRDQLPHHTSAILDLVREAFDRLRADPCAGLPQLGPATIAPSPLVRLEPNADSLAFARHAAAEDDLRQTLKRLHDAPDSVVDPSILERLDGLPGMRLHPGQRNAVDGVLRHSLCLVTGGPGTGKTTVVARALLAMAWSDSRITSESVALCAPTGRAKARLQESLRSSLAPLAPDDACARELSRLPSHTLHTLLGVRAGRRPRHHRENPLPHRVVVLDEASMVDLPLFAALANALSPDARLVVVGDPDQLSSVDPGAVLADLLANPDLSRFARPLVHSHRNAGGIAKFCQLANQGNPPAVDALPLAPDAPSLWGGLESGSVLRILPQDLPRRLEDWMELWVGPHLEAIRDLAQGPPRPEVFASISLRRILCMVHDGPLGAIALNRACDTWLRHRLGIAWSAPWVPLQQVILGRNHPELDLWNGDLGLILEQEGKPVVVFPREADHLTIPVDRLSGLESAWAITTHKSQGSEFDHVLCVFPDRDAPVLTRQIVYTAASRSKKTLWLSGDLSLVGTACARTDDRRSRVRDPM